MIKDFYRLQAEVVGVELLGEWGGFGKEVDKEPCENKCIRWRQGSTGVPIVDACMA